jgi:hypothetical protein
LWLSNDEGLYRDTTRLVENILAEADPRAAESTHAVADAIEGFVNDLPDVANVRMRASFVSDLLGASLSDVDWREIAEAWMENR